MSEKDNILKDIGSAEYKHGFETQVEQEFIPKGLNEDIIRLISEKKGEPQWLLEFRLKAYRKWLTMKMPTWAHLDIPDIDFQDIIYFAAPKKASEKKEIDPELMATFDKLGIPLHERSVLAGTHSPAREKRAGRHSGGRSVRLRIGQDYVPRVAGRERHHLLFVLRGRARLSRPGAQVLSVCGAYR